MAAVDPSYQLLACQYLREQLGKLAQELRGVRANDAIEPVHQARVASRRIRAAFRMFGDCLDDKRLAKWNKRIRALTKDLGVARDKDVQIDFVEQVIAVPEANDRQILPGLRRLLLRLRQSRNALQPTVLKTLDKLDRGNVLADMHGELEKTWFTLRSNDVSLQSPFVLARAAGHIRGKIHGLVAHDHTLDDPEDEAGHHQMRIAAKRLRYTMEISDLAYEGELAPFIKAIKKVQTLLGDIHDCDVWAEDIDAFMEEERLRTIDYFGHARPFARLRGGLVFLREERKEHRRRTFAELAAYWKTLGEEGLRDELESTLRSHDGTARQGTTDRQNVHVDVAEEDGKDRTTQ